RCVDQLVQHGKGRGILRRNLLCRLRAEMLMPSVSGWSKVGWICAAVPAEYSWLSVVDRAVPPLPEFMEGVQAMLFLQRSSRCWEQSRRQQNEVARGHCSRAALGS